MRSPERRGIEALLQMAADDEMFADILLSDRAQAIAASGIQLSMIEQAILDAMDDSALSRTLANIKPTPRPPEEPRPAEPMGIRPNRPIKGIRPDRLGPEHGIRPDREPRDTIPMRTIPDDEPRDTIPMRTIPDDND